MKLLFDHNLSPRLVSRLADLYSDSQHIFLLGLDQASDMTVWVYAQTNDYIIVTKDSDFSDVSICEAFHPKCFGSVWAIALPTISSVPCETAMMQLMLLPLILRSAFSNF